MDLNKIFDCLISLECRLEDDIACEKAGVSSGYKVFSLHKENQKVKQCIKDVQTCLEKK